MWGRLYLALVLVRLYFAWSPSYIHPDEHFQGPEIIAGQVFSWPSYLTWEFTSAQPIRSVFPLWLIYGPPLTLLKWIWEGVGHGEVPPDLAFYTLRLMMFMLSFVLEDWALHELIPLPRERRTARLLVASSYVTWTFQTHTFSNSIETLIILWCIVLMGRIRNDRVTTQVTACIGLAFLGVLGVFNRITFPAFIVIPAVQLLPHLLQKPARVVVILVTGLAVAAAAIVVDTHFYMPGPIRLRDLPKTAILTPWNNLAYNLDPSNLATHGLHPFYQHFLANLPQLLGPAILLLLSADYNSPLLWTALTGIALLSCFNHQEARFLLPSIPLLLVSFRLPSKNKTLTHLWLASWIIFNVFAGILFGTYHQGGVVSTQVWLAKQEFKGEVFWWKTYSPPRWPLSSRNSDLATVDLMGLPGEDLVSKLEASASCAFEDANKTLLVAPGSATFLDAYKIPSEGSNKLNLEHLWSHRQHIGLDDLDFGDDGVWPTLQRVIGRRGLIVWEIRRPCESFHTIHDEEDSHQDTR